MWSDVVSCGCGGGEMWCDLVRSCEMSDVAVVNSITPNFFQ